MKRTLRFLAVTALTVGACWYVASSVDFSTLITIIRQSNVWLLAATIPVIAYSHVVRAVRWRRIITADPSTIPLIPAIGAVLIGYAASTVVPRSGELLRPMYLSQHTNVSAVTAVSSVVLERVLDVIALLLAILVLVALHPSLILNVFPDFSPSLALFGFLTPVLGTIAFVFALVFTRTIPQWLIHVTATIHKKTAVRLKHMLASVQEGVSVVNRRHVWPTILWETVLMWMLYVIPLWLILAAMPVTGGPYTLVDAAVLLVVISVGVTIAPTPGALGVYHGFAQVAMMRVFGASPSEGLGFALIAWSLNYGVVLLSGGLWFIYDQHRLAQTPSNKRGRRSRRP